MSLLSIVVFIIILLVTTARTESRQDPQHSNLRDYFNSMVNNQSEKVLRLFGTIQTKARSMLTRLKSMEKSKTPEKEKQQIEAPEVKKRFEKSLESIKGTQRSYGKHNSHYTTGYSGGHPTGGANYIVSGGPTSTYHHHSIGFDPINIVLSVSLLSFILQALQGLLNRTAMLPQVVQARSLGEIQQFWQTFEKYGKSKSQKHFKKKYYKYLMNKQ